MNIFQALAHFIKSFWDWAGWKSILLLAGALWFILKEGLGFVLGFLNTIGTLANTLTDFDLTAASTAFFSNDIIKLANFFVPLDVMMQSLAIIVIAFPIAVTVRIIKSWLPTVSG